MIIKEFGVYSDGSKWVEFKCESEFKTLKYKYSSKGILELVFETTDSIRYCLPDLKAAIERTLDEKEKDIFQLALERMENKITEEDFRIKHQELIA